MKLIYKSGFAAFDLDLILQNKVMWIKICVITGVFFFAIHSVIPVVMKTWSRYDYSHGFLIPFISLYLIWIKREKLKEILVIPNYSGGITVLLLGSFILVLARIGSVHIVQLLSIIIIIAGIILLLFGGNYLKALSIPVAYLVLAVPFFDLFFSEISFPLQLLAANTAVAVLDFFNVPVLQHAQYIELPEVTLEVTPGCSGISYLISFIAIGIPLAFFTQRHLSRRLMVIAFAIFCPIVANMLRVTLIGLYAYYGDAKAVHGPLHIYIGAFISVVGFIVLFAAAWFFADTPKRQNKAYSTKGEAVSVAEKNSRRTPFAWLISIVILFSLGSYLNFYQPEPVQLKKSLDALNFKIGDRTGIDAVLYKDVFKFPGEADSEIMRTYRDSSEHEINLYIGYFESQNQSKEFIHYTMQSLYNNSEEIEIAIDKDTMISVNRATLAMGAEYALPVIYWYDINGKIIANRYAAKLLTAFNGFIRGATNGAMIIVYSDNRPHDKIEQAFNDELDFVKEIIPVLGEYF